MKHNNQLPNGHFHKHWQVRVRTWLDQAGRKKRRRAARVEKAKRMAPRPTEALRPAVRCQTIKYNTRLRTGRGFTAEEVKAVGITKAYARSVGIAVDHRRRNRSEESLALNKQRLQAYLEKLVIIPNKSSAKGFSQVSLESVLPIDNTKTVEPARKVTAEEKAAPAYSALRGAWAKQRYAGMRAKRAAEKADVLEIKKEK